MASAKAAWRRSAPIELVRYSAEGPSPSLEVDSDLICQVLLGLLGLLGLLENAADVTPDGSQIALGTHWQGASAIFEVTDAGPGVPRDLRERIFEPFFTTRQDGAGLGLAVARPIVCGHGGALSVHDAPGGGARFEIALPIHGGAERVA